MSILTSWTAIDEHEATDGARDLLGTGAIADRIAEEIAPNLRQGTSRARYYTMLAVGAHVVDGTGNTPAQRLRSFFRWERLWLAAIFEHHLPDDGSTAKLQYAIRTKEDGLLGAGIRGASSKKFLELRDRGVGRIDLEEFVPLKAPQTSGVYGRYAGSARDVRILSEAGGLALGNAGTELVASFEDQLGQAQFVKKAREAVAEGECSLTAALIKSLAALRLCRPQQRERELLIGCLVEGDHRTLLAARVIWQNLDGSSPPEPNQWRAAIPKCARAARELGGEGALLSDALLAALGYDPVRTSLEALLLAASQLAERSRGWDVNLAALAEDRSFSRQVSALQEAAEGFRGSPEIESTRELRSRLQDHDLSTLTGVIELLCAQHAAVCQARGIGTWVSFRRGRLEFARRITGATAAGLARYRLGSLTSLIRDLQWKVKA